MNDDREAKLKDKERRLRVEVIGTLTDMGIEVQSLATWLDVSRMTVYRWLGDFFRPTVKDFAKIDLLLETANKVKKDWTDVLISYNGHFHKAVRLTLYKPKARRILESQLAYDEKISRLVALTFNSWAKEKERRND